VLMTAARPAGALERGMACEEVPDVLVATELGGARDTRLSVEICWRRQLRSTMAVLVHGASYDRRYHEELAEYLARRGVAALNVSLIGAGLSDYPADASWLTIHAQAAAVADLLAQLRGGELATSRGPLQPEHVVLVGHSLGAMAATVVDVMAPGLVDGLVLHGYSHVLGPRAFDSFFLAYPANFEPQFSHLSFDYATTVPVFPEPFPQAGEPGVREHLFFYSPAVDAETLAWDEANKQAYTFAMLGTIEAAMGASFAVTAPTLVVVGNYDLIVCEAPSCTATGSLAHEGQMFPLAASFDVVIVDDVGHSINLHDGAQEAYRVTLDWIREMIAWP
jgi:pimeloyl-ACP methyl ester carboxylesterase